MRGDLELTSMSVWLFEMPSISISEHVAQRTSIIAACSKPGNKYIEALGQYAFNPKLRNTKDQ
jgi:hypothetical protein